MFRPYPSERTYPTVSTGEAHGRFLRLVSRCVPCQPGCPARDCDTVPQLGHQSLEEVGAPILDAPEGRRDEFVQPYFKAAKPDQVVCILKAREPARIITAIGNKKENRWHLELKQRWVDQYNFYINDGDWGRIFVRICPYLPFSARVCLNQHHWIATSFVTIRSSRAGLPWTDLVND